jgi:hypothetical protein
MTKRHPVDELAAQAMWISTQPLTIEAAMAAERAANTHAGLVRSDGEILMSMNHLHRRLDRIKDEDIDLAASLEASHQKAEQRLRDWILRGNLGHPPFGPLILPRPNATAADHRIWRLLAQGRARVIHGRDPEASPLNDLKEIYELTDDALVAAINSHKSSEIWPPEGGVPA